MISRVKSWRYFAVANDVAVDCLRDRRVYIGWSIDGFLMRRWQMHQRPTSDEMNFTLRRKFIGFWIIIFHGASLFRYIVARNSFYAIVYLNEELRVLFWNITSIRKIKIILFSQSLGVAARTSDVCRTRCAWWLSNHATTVSNATSAVVTPLVSVPPVEVCIITQSLTPSFSLTGFSLPKFARTTEFSLDRSIFFFIFSLHRWKLHHQDLPQWTILQNRKWSTDLCQH